MASKAIKNFEEINTYSKEKIEGWQDRSLEYDCELYGKLIDALWTGDSGFVKKFWEDTDLKSLQYNAYNPLMIMVDVYNREKSPYDLIQFAFEKARTAGLLEKYLKEEYQQLNVLERLSWRPDICAQLFEIYFKFDKDSVGLNPTAEKRLIAPLNGPIAHNSLDATEFFLKLPKGPEFLTQNASSHHWPIWNALFKDNGDGKELNFTLIKLLFKYDTARNMTKTGGDKYNFLDSVCNCETMTDEIFEFCLNQFDATATLNFSFKLFFLPIHRLCRNKAITPKMLDLLMKKDLTKKSWTVVSRDNLRPLNPLQNLLSLIAGEKEFSRRGPPFWPRHILWLREDGSTDESANGRRMKEQRQKNLPQNLWNSDQEQIVRYRNDLQSFKEYQINLKARIDQNCKNRSPPNYELVKTWFANDTEGLAVLQPYPEYNNGNSLHYAAIRSLPDVVSMILKTKNGEKASKAVDTNGDTPYTLALKKEDPAVVGAMSSRARGEMPSQATPEQQLKFALKTQQPAIINLLIKKDATLFAKPLRTDGANALSLAAQYGEPETFMTVLKSQEDTLSYVQASNLKGRNLFQQLIAKDNANIISLLMKSYPDIVNTFLTTSLLYDSVVAPNILQQFIEYIRANPTALDIPTIWDLSNRGLSDVEFPSVFHDLEIEEVNMSNNLLSRIPLSVFQIPTLKTLNFSHNKIADIRAADVAVMTDYSIRHKKRKEINVNISQNRIQTIPPEIYSLHNFVFDTTKNPLATGLTWPSWFFGIRFTGFNLLVMDTFYLFIVLAVLLVGALFRVAYDLRIVEFTFLVIFFATLFLAVSWVGLVSISWADQPKLFRWLRGLDRKGGVLGDSAGLDPDAEDRELQRALTMVQSPDEENQRDYDAKPKKKKNAVKRFWKRYSDILAIIAIIVEFPTVFAFSFEYGGWPKWASSVVNVFLLNFDFNEYASDAGVSNGVNWDSVAFQVGFWLAVAGVILQRGLLELSRYPRFSGLAVTVLSSSLDLTGLAIFSQLVKGMNCTYDLTDSTQALPIGSATLDGSGGQCWQSYHLILVGISMVCFILFYPMSAIATTIFANREKDLAIRFPSYFLIISQQLKFLLALLNGFFSSVKALYLTINIIVSISLFALLMLVAWNPDPKELPLTKRARLLKIGIYFCAVLGSIASTISSFLDEDARTIVFIVLLVSDAVVFIVCFILMVRVKSLPEPSTNDRNSVVELVDINAAGAGNKQETTNVETNTVDDGKTEKKD